MTTKCSKRKPKRACSRRPTPWAQPRSSRRKADLDDLVGRFGWHARILGWIAKALEKLQGKLMALAPWAPVAVAAVWLLMLGYAVVVGGDHLDWHRLGDEGTFDVVLGVRRTVDIGLAGAS